MRKEGGGGGEHHDVEECKKEEDGRLEEEEEWISYYLEGGVGKEERGKGMFRMEGRGK